MPTSDSANDEDASLETNDVEPLDEDESSEPELRRSTRERRSSTRYSPEEYVTVTSEGGASRAINITPCMRKCNRCRGIGIMTLPSESGRGN